MNVKKKYYTNLYDSLKLLCENPVYIHTLHDAQFQYFAFVEKDHRLAQITPTFKKDENNEIVSDFPPGFFPTDPYLLHYILKTIIRGVLLGLRFSQAGELLIREQFLSVAITSFYTASFHYLQSFLASNGLVIINLPEGQKEQLGVGGKLIIAKFTGQGEWKIEGLGRNHDKIWGKFTEGLDRLDETPQFLNDFFVYLLGLKAQDAINSRDLIQKGLGSLANIRHESIYEGYGFDDYAMDEVFSWDRENRLDDKLLKKALKNKALIYKRFSEEMIHLSLVEILSLKKQVLDKYWDEIKELMTISIFIPPIETGSPDFTNNAELRQLTKAFRNWIDD